MSFSAEEDPKKVNGRSDVTIRPLDGTGARRRITGDLHIRIPVIGGTVEKRIVPGFVRRLDVEADAVRLRLGDPDPGQE